MTERQKRFVEEYQACGNATEAAKKAGYAADHAHVEGHRQLRNAKVVHALQESGRKRAERLEIDADHVMNSFEAIRQAAMDTGDLANANRATENEAKLLGLYVDKQEVSGKDGEPLKVVVEYVKRDPLAIAGAPSGATEDS